MAYRRLASVGHPGELRATIIQNQNYVSLDAYSKQTAVQGWQESRSTTSAERSPPPPRAEPNRLTACTHANVRPTKNNHNKGETCQTRQSAGERTLKMAARVCRLARPDPPASGPAGGEGPGTREGRGTRDVSDTRVVNALHVGKGSGRAGQRRIASRREGGKRMQVGARLCHRPGARPGARPATLHPRLRTFLRRSTLTTKMQSNAFIEVTLGKSRLRSDSS